ncbi:hypothetical protein WR25_12363 [Diploscapter pachys]|uniref:aralkylamine N-acetyltransferase n=1 Tax=Diploscapter pachys TaxID=2018661 RepID=A0A2A2J9R3_9BILA|nr:hypothetical protein WR25_12363 [Diploscapter pachys]
MINTCERSGITTKDVDIDQLEYLEARECDRYAIKDFLIENFLHDEPNNRATGLTEEEFEPVMNEIIDKALAHPISTVVKYQGEIVAVQLNSLWKRSEKSYDSYSNTFTPASVLARILDDCHNVFWSLVPDNVETVVYREIGNVRKDFYRRGIGKRLIFEGLTPEKFEGLNIDGVASINTSIAQQTNLRKAGFMQLKEILISNYKDENDKPLYQTDDGTDRFVLNFMPKNKFLQISEENNH